MPVHPSEEEAPGGIYEKVAKDPSSTTESTASDHENHANEHAPEASAKAAAEDFQSKGPQIPMNMNGTLTDPQLKTHPLPAHALPPIAANVIGPSDMPPKAGKEELRARAEELNKE